ncbi:MAG: homocysteine S-methyltransferase family protein [Cyanobacteria bacterium P01_H01_bin.162]
MSRYRYCLPQLADRYCLTDGGLETTLIFKEGQYLPEFAAFDLLKNTLGTAALHKYFRTYAGLARDFEAGCLLESATWRASLDWAERLGYTRQAIAELNHKAIELLHTIRDEFETPGSPMVISGCIGPRGDGYSPTDQMPASEAEAYHRFQTDIFHAAGADLITGVTMTYAEEAMGIVRAAQAGDMPVVISFTVETDGCLPTGQSLAAAIAQVDNATDGYVSYYMINCAHPLHFAHTLQPGAAWLRRIGGIRPNASLKSHAELDEATELDEGNPQDLGRQCAALHQTLPNLRVLGGCCGTDERHVAAIFAQFLAASRSGDAAHPQLA